MAAIDPVSIRPQPLAGRPAVADNALPGTELQNQKISRSATSGGRVARPRDRLTQAF
jgi:hypothetical protein